MKNYQGTKDHTKCKPYLYASDRFGKGTSFENKFFTIVSLGTIASGSLACLASAGIGMTLVILGTMVLAEL